MFCTHRWRALNSTSLALAIEVKLMSMVKRVLKLASRFLRCAFFPSLAVRVGTVEKSSLALTSFVRAANTILPFDSLLI